MKQSYQEACLNKPVLSGTIKPLQDKNSNRALFAPSDYRLPRLLIPMSDCPKGFIIALLYSPLNIESDKQNLWMKICDYSCIIHFKHVFRVL